MSATSILRGKDGQPENSLNKHTFNEFKTIFTDRSGVFGMQTYFSKYS
jgi:hypothetical protein